jgi:hypothetical protein
MGYETVQLVGDFHGFVKPATSAAVNLGLMQ